MFDVYTCIYPFSLSIYRYVCVCELAMMKKGTSHWEKKGTSHLKKTLICLFSLCVANNGINTSEIDRLALSIPSML